MGWTCTLLWLPSCGDKRGRKKIYWIVQMIQVALYLGLLITKHLGVMIAIWFLFGALSSVRMNIGYVYLMEMLPEKW